MDVPDKVWRGHLAEGSLMLQRAPSGAFVFPPKISEPGTGEPLEWVEASGLGEVYSSTVIRAKPPAAAYSIALIELEEKVRMMSRVEGVAPEAVRIGMKVRAEIVEEDGRPLVIFRPAA